MSVAETIRAIAVVEGIKAAAEWAAANRVNLSIVRFALFGRY